MQYWNPKCSKLAVSSHIFIYCSLKRRSKYLWLFKKRKKKKSWQACATVLSSVWLARCPPALRAGHITESYELKKLLLLKKITFSHILQTRSSVIVLLELSFWQDMLVVEYSLLFQLCLVSSPPSGSLTFWMLDFVPLIGANFVCCLVLGRYWDICGFNGAFYLQKLCLQGLMTAAVAKA